MARRVDQVELVGLAVLRLIGDPDRLGLDRDAALALEIHGIQHLLLHLPAAERTGALEQAIRQRRLAMVDVGDDREVADQGEVHAAMEGLPDGKSDRRALSPALIVAIRQQAVCSVSCDPLAARHALLRPAWTPRHHASRDRDHFAGSAVKSTH